MNYHLFSAFLLITFVLVIVPGPIVTLVIATGATRGCGRLYARQRPIARLHRVRVELDPEDFF